MSASISLVFLITGTTFPSSAVFLADKMARSKALLVFLFPEFLGGSLGTFQFFFPSRDLAESFPMALRARARANNARSASRPGNGESAF